MADVTINAGIGSLANARAQRAGPHFVNKDVGYRFFVDADDDLFYEKTSDGGEIWGAPVEIDTDTTILALGFDTWPDWATPGDSGTKIHICWFDSSNDDICYRALDTNGDTFGAKVIVQAESSAVAAVGAHCSITKAVGGNLYVSWECDASGERGFERSTDGGGTWAARTIQQEATGDWSMLFPAPNAADTQDIDALYFDLSASALTLKRYDDSANTWSESAAIATVVSPGIDGQAQYPFAGALRHSDGHLIVNVITERDTATSDHRVFDLDGPASITELAPIATNIPNHFHPQIFIPNTGASPDDIYVAYNGKRDGSEDLVGDATKIYYTKSTDDGDSWSAGDTAYMEGAAAGVSGVRTPITGERFYVSWTNQGATLDLEGNFVNSLDLSSVDLVLTADPGSVSISGTLASLERGLRLAAAAGSVAITGTAASLEYGRRLAAAAGAIGISGTAALLELARQLDAAAGSVAITGSAASLEKGTRLAAQGGSFAISGTAAEFAIGKALIADPGSVAISGTAASLEASKRLSAQAGAFAVSGQTASLEQARRLAAEAGGFAITGSEATLTLAADKAIIAEAGSVAIAGTAASLEQARRLVADAGAVSIAGQAAVLALDRRLSAEAGGVAIDGAAAALSTARRLDASPGAYAIAGTDAEISKGRKIVALAGEVLITGAAAGMRATRELSAQAGGFTITGQASTLHLNRAVAAEAGAILISGTAAALRGTRKLEAAPGSYAIGGAPSALVRGLLLRAGAGAIVIEGGSALFHRTGRLDAQPGSIAIAGTDAGLVYQDFGETPAGRIYRVPREQRTAFAPQERRSFGVPQEERAHFVPAEVRTHAVPGENRTLKVGHA